MQKTILTLAVLGALGWFGYKYFVNSNELGNSQNSAEGGQQVEEPIEEVQPVTDATLLFDTGQWEQAAPMEAVPTRSPSC
jgi:predicted negative regulator of RcsB-dependent stress response